MIVTWSGKLFTLRVSRCDFDSYYANLNQPELALVLLVIVIAGDPVIDVLDPGANPGCCVIPVEVQPEHSVFLSG